MNLLRALVVRLGDRLNADRDAYARACGLTLTRTPDGHTIVSDPRMPAFADARRARVLRDGPDPIDRALMDHATRALLKATADQRRADAGKRTRMPATARTAILEAAPGRRCCHGTGVPVYETIGPDGYRITCPACSGERRAA